MTQPFTDASRRDHHRTDQAAEEGVGGAGREAKQPGQQVPDDRADEASQNDPCRDQFVVEEAAGDGLGNPSRKTRTHEIEDGRENDGSTGLERSVAIGPAIALALSWKPFVKSKIKATRMTAITTNSSVNFDPIWTAFRCW